MSPSSARSATKEREHGFEGDRQRVALASGSSPIHSTSEPGSTWAAYTHDANGNMVAMPHLAELEYTHRNQMCHADLGGGGNAYYTYDLSGERVRKFIQRNGTTTDERIYLGGWELYRKRTGSSQVIETERETLHVMDDTRRIAMVETLTVEDEETVSSPVPRFRFQYGNHLDSAHLECDDDGLVISYEEYHPYGTPAYRSARSGTEVSEKRYRYTGKERDEETGFSYHQWRYYAPWLARWTGSDPEHNTSPLGGYTYAACEPLGLLDSDGREPIVSGTHGKAKRRPDDTLAENVGRFDAPVKFDLSPRELSAPGDALAVVELDLVMTKQQATILFHSKTDPSTPDKYVQSRSLLAHEETHVVLSDRFFTKQNIAEILSQAGISLKLEMKRPPQVTEDEFKDVADPKVRSQLVKKRQEMMDKEFSQEVQQLAIARLKAAKAYVMEYREYVQWRLLHHEAVAAKDPTYPVQMKIPTFVDPQTKASSGPNSYELDMFMRDLGAGLPGVRVPGIYGYDYAEDPINSRSIGRSDTPNVAPKAVRAKLLRKHQVSPSTARSAPMVKP